ncbi:MAG: hypothetical protein LJF30_16410 [Acidobacteria bacterium]|nr:hypothetical protein [Acidobacteriota bacterium]
MELHYRHTQIGWVILGALAALAVLVAPRLPAGGLGVAGGPLLVVLAVVLLLFSTLTVEVGREALRLRFGVGLIRKRFALTEIRGWEAVRNPWYCGWGIRLTPGGVLWNVSGYDAVELTLADGRRFRIGTDEPAALVAAIARARPGVSPVSAAGTLPLTAPGARAWVPLLLVVLALLLVLGPIFWLQMRPPAVSVRADGFEVESLFYGTTLAADDITAISLETTLPRVLARTNGFAAAGILRGHFNVEGLGSGRLYVDAGAAPYVLVRLRDGFVIVNLPQPEQTRALYEQMARAWPDRAGER